MAANGRPFARDVHASARFGRIAARRVAHASRVLVVASRENELQMISNTKKPGTRGNPFVRARRPGRAVNVNSIRVFIVRTHNVWTWRLELDCLKHSSLSGNAELYIFGVGT
jgi:hypothetical protein